MYYICEAVYTNRVYPTNKEQIITFTLVQQENQICKVTALSMFYLSYLKEGESSKPLVQPLAGPKQPAIGGAG